MERNEEQPKSEAVERPWASNDKLQFDNTLNHANRVAIYGELAIKESLDFTKQIHQQIIENNRKTLSYLYDLEIPEAVANKILAKIDAKG